MKRLVNSQLLCMLKKMDRTFNLGEYDIRSVYEDFVHRVIILCTSEKESIPAYFTIHYTRLELEKFRMLLSDEGAGKKCSNSKLHNS
mgnify:CR=1 FL=1